METWKRIEGYPDYEVSDLGRVVSYKRPSAPRLMKLSIHPNGHRFVGLTRHENGYAKTTAHLVHRLVALAFIPNDDPEVKTHVLHTVAVKAGGSDAVTNLRWGTHRENIMDSVRAGTQHPVWRSGFNAGEAHGAARFSEADVLDMRRLRASGASLKEIAAKYDTSITTVSDIANRRNWKHI